MNKDQVEGRVEASKGKVKEVVGRVIDDQDMENEGSLQKMWARFRKAMETLSKI